MSKLNTVLSSVLPSLGVPNSPISWPAADTLVAYYQWQYRTYISTLRRSGTGVPLTWSGSFPISCALVVKITVGGSSPTGKFQWSSDSGATYNGTDLSIAAAVALGNGITLNFVGSYVLNETYTMGILGWTDRGSGGYHFGSVDGLPGNPDKAPVPFNTAHGSALKFDGVHSMLLQNTVGTAVVTGTNKPFYILSKVSIDSLLSAIQVILWFGDAVTLHAMMWDVNASNLHGMLSQMNSGANRSFASGSPNSSVNVMECYCDGSAGFITVNGTQVATGTIYSGALTAPKCTIGKSFNAGAEGNPSAISMYNLNLYNALPSAPTRAQLRQLMGAF